MSSVRNLSKQKAKVGMSEGAKGIFITGTDTGVGKTIVCGLLGLYFANAGYRVITQKWVQTGRQGFSSDVSLHLKLMHRQKKEVKDYWPYLSVYNLRFASSPHLAASLEKIEIRPEKIKNTFRYLAQHFDFVIVEGTGGALVPLDRKRLLIDIVRELNLPLLIIVANKLGAINHSLLTIEALKKRNLKILGIIFNNKIKKLNRIIAHDNVQIIKKISGAVVLGTLPWEKDKNCLYQTFIPIGKRILSYLKKNKNGKLD
jgi:dethiobiotin synthetase